ncbi:hypothetical protein SHIRM173S_09744 [Streptomyces hirsutus]
MGIIAWIVIGLLAGIIAKVIMPGKDPGGIIITMLIGIAGGLLGGWLGKVIFGVDSIDGFFELSTWIAAIVGSLILLLCTASSPATGIHTVTPDPLIAPLDGPPRAPGGSRRACPDRALERPVRTGKSGRTHPRTTSAPGTPRRRRADGRRRVSD